MESGYQWKDLQEKGRLEWILSENMKHLNQNVPVARVQIETKT